MTEVAAGPAGLIPFDRSSRAYHNRWWILGVMCLSLLVIIVDNSILNVALPRLVIDLDASNSELQWIVDSYTLVFAGLLLTAGSLGDRFGRRRALQFGLVVFGLGSVLAALSDSAAQLIVTRGLMGIGGAFIMPATLSIITNVFPPDERGRAIGMWAGIAGVATALGPITGGFLLEHFYWGSVFLVNIPIVIVALFAGAFIVPNSFDPTKPKQDPVGALLSIVGLVAVLFAIIEGPERGWTDPVTIGAFVIGAVVLIAFALWERHSDHPMLDLKFFENPRFTAASLGITSVFFAMFGATFLLTQMLQLVMGYSPLKAGAALLPWAAVMLVVAPNSPRLVERFGTKAVVTSGLALVAIALALLATVPVDATYLGDVVWRMMIMAFGMALVMAPATESIMGSLPRAKAGVGSAVNDTTRQVGGALGVAIVGSVMSSIYRGDMSDVLSGTALPPAAAEQAQSSLGGALRVAGEIGGETGAALARAAQEAFVSGMHRGVLVAAAAAAIGAFVTWRWLPARGVDAGMVFDEEPAGLQGAEAVAGGAPAIAET